MSKLKDITLLVWDEMDNFNSNATQLRIGPTSYKKVKLIQSRADFESELADLKDDDQFVLVVHVFHAKEDGVALRGFLQLQSSEIEEDYQISAVFVSSGDSGIVMKDIYDNEKKSVQVFSYSSIRDNLKEGKIGLYRKSSLRHQNGSSDFVTGNGYLKNGIFLSHSSSDGLVVDKFREIFLHGGLGVDLADVMFTSSEQFGLPAGGDIPEALRTFLVNKMGLFIQFVSPNYSASRICLNEEGAAWCLLPEEMIITITIGKFDINDLSWQSTLKKAINIRAKESLLNLYQHRINFFPKVNVTRLAVKVQDFVASLDV